MQLRGGGAGNRSLLESSTEWKILGETMSQQRSHQCDSEVEAPGIEPGSVRRPLNLRSRA